MTEIHHTWLRVFYDLNHDEILCRAFYSSSLEETCSQGNPGNIYRIGQPANALMLLFQLLWTLTVSQRGFTLWSGFKLPNSRQYCNPLHGHHVPSLDSCGCHMYLKWHSEYMWIRVGRAMCCVLGDDDDDDDGVMSSASINALTPAV